MTGRWADDLSLVQRMLEGDESAFAAFFNGYFPRVYRFALPRLCGDPEAGKEVAQATMIKALRSLEQFRGDASLFTWVCQICRNQVIDHARALRRRNARVVSIEDSSRARHAFESVRAPAEDQPMRSLVATEMLQLVRSLLDELPSRYGDVLEWKYLDERSVEEIAELLGVSTTAAQSMLARARIALREAVERTLGSSPSEVLAQMHVEG